MVHINLILRIVVLFSLLVHPYANGQTICSRESRVRLDSMLQWLRNQNFDHQGINEVAVEIGSWFINTAYVEKTLEVPGGDEPLVINLVELDCTTYVETIIALARLAKMQRFDFEDYEKQLTLLRYRDGERAHYPSRLHYFSDWIHNNEEKGLLKDITKEIGGIEYENHPSFMSSNPQFYPQLSDSANVREIEKTEEAIKERDYYYISKGMIEEHEKNLSPGDLIAITIDIDRKSVV